MPLTRAISPSIRLLVPAFLLLVVAAGLSVATDDAASGQMAGFGMTLAIQDGNIVVVQSEPGAAAHNSGVRVGDTFTSIDGVPLDNSTLEQVYARLVSSRSDAVSVMVRRKAGGRQELRLKRPREVAAPPGRQPLTLRGASASGIPGPQSTGRPAVISRSTIKVGDELVDFTLPRLGGGEIKLSEYRGKPLLVDFWATWCGPCRAEAPALAAIYERFGETIQIIGVSLDYTPGMALQYAREAGLNYPQAISDGWEDPVIQEFGIHRTGIPFNILYDHQGRVAAMDLHGEPLAEALELLLRKE
jgi:thiol-disulfide isomerase/thioredoxin